MGVALRYSLNMTRLEDSIGVVLAMGALKMLDVKMQDVKQTDGIAGHEIAGHDHNLAKC